MSEEGIQFKALVDSVKIDRLGEVKVVLEVSSKYRDNALLCGALTQKIVDVKIVPSTEQMLIGTGKRKTAPRVDIE